jgi:hypothetical protein
MKDPQLRVVDKHEQMKTQPKTVPPKQQPDVYYSMLHQSTPIKNVSESQVRRTEGWHQKKSNDYDMTSKLLEAQAEQTFAMEYERTAQLTERRGFLSGVLHGSRQTFIYTIALGGFGLLIWKLYQLERRIK